MTAYIQLTCPRCGSIFDREARVHKYEQKINGPDYQFFCTQECFLESIRNKIVLNCDQCGFLIQKTKSEILDHNFCDSKCAATYNNLHRDKTPTKKVKCKFCETILYLLSWSIKKVCDVCRRKVHTPKKVKKFNCVSCNAEILSKSTLVKYCKPCRKAANKITSVKAGLASAALQVRRSKNEIYFAELCTQYFQHITTNDPIFVSKNGNWDADVIVHDHKIAVLWNGAWHYKTIRKGHSLKQVQTRDKIKLDVIVKNGFISYTIIDMGRANKTFVEIEFDKFKAFVAELVAANSK